MSQDKWEHWVARALKGEHLHEPRAAVMPDARSLRRRLKREAVSRFHVSLRGVAAAAVLIAAVGTGLMMIPKDGPVLPSRTTDSIVRGTRVELVAPLGELTSAPQTLRWLPVDHAVHYQVQIFTVDDTLLWEATTDRATIDLPEETQSQLFPAVAYLWRVEAQDADGGLIAQSETARFRTSP